MFAGLCERIGLLYEIYKTLYTPPRGGIPPLPPYVEGGDWRGAQGFVDFVQKSYSSYLPN